jgi:hypothetical protein
MTTETHVLLPTEIDREKHRAALDVWNDCMMNAETLEMTWPKLVKAIAAIDVTHTSQPNTGTPPITFEQWCKSYHLAENTVSRAAWRDARASVVWERQSPEDSNRFDPASGVPDPISNSYQGPHDDSPYVPSWCYENAAPLMCSCGHHHGYHNDAGCNQCACKAFFEEPTINRSVATTTLDKPEKNTGSPSRQQIGADNGGIASAPLIPSCEHEWARRRDGRRCHKCEKVELGAPPPQTPAETPLADRLMDWSLNPGITDPLLVKELREASVSLSIFPPDPRNAERYRWIRLASVDPAISEAFVNVCESEPETPELFDAAIDKAMRATTA